MLEVGRRRKLLVFEGRDELILKFMGGRGERRFDWIENGCENNGSDFFEFGDWDWV